MKAVLIPIQPLECELISKRKKRVIITKRKSRLETPFKCYIYQTKTKRRGYLWQYDTAIITSGGDVVDGSQKVIGEFVCDRIDEYVNHFMAWRDKNGKQFNTGEFLSNACLTLDEVSNYIAGSIKFYGWHISELKIYDKPKELSEFRVVDENAVIYCQYRERICVNPDFTNGAQLKGGYICAKDKITPHWCEKCLSKHITRAPRNWCYVEELE